MEKVKSVIYELEKRAKDARQQQKLSRDEKKQFYYLGCSNEIEKAISLIKRTFYQELNVTK